MTAGTAVHPGVALWLSVERITTKVEMAASTPKTSRHTEVERKFDVVDSTVSPSFEGLSSVARVERSPSQQLEAIYFDTPAHDLAAHHITLRRRTGGSDAGWHLKLPAGPDTRTEVRAALGDGDGRSVPGALKDVVLAIVRDRTLGPVARICTERTIDLLYGPEGAPIAEFSDDKVTASAGEGSEQQWREWELELVEGASTSPELLDRLANRLLDAGAVPAGHGSKLARVLAGATDDDGSESDATKADPIHQAVAEQVDQLVEWDRAVRADVYDSVHQMRVTTRKIRSLLQSSEGSFGISDDAWVLEELRQLASVLGVARDAEVLAERYERALEGAAGGPRPRSDPETVGGRRQAALQGRAAALVDRDAFGALLPPARCARRVGGRRAGRGRTR